MDLQLQGKRAVVTGSSSGIGEAIARMLAREGVAVVVQGRKEPEVQRVADAIAAAGSRSAVAVGDLTDAASAARVAQSARSAFGGIDILVNNAGAFPTHTWTKGTPEQWAALFDQNVLSMVRMIQHLVPGMRQAGWGRVINLASVAATTPLGNMPDYSVTKAANANLTVSLAKDLTGTGVTVNSVSPGPIVTRGFEDMARRMAKAHGWGDDWAVIERHMVELMPNPCNRLGRPEDVAAVVAFLASPLAGYVNGANVRVDGGGTPSVN